jgi:hypothetical protein
MSEAAAEKVEIGTATPKGALKSNGYGIAQAMP